MYIIEQPTEINEMSDIYSNKAANSLSSNEWNTKNETILCIWLSEGLVVSKAFTFNFRCTNKKVWLIFEDVDFW